MILESYLQLRSNKALLKQRIIVYNCVMNMMKFVLIFLSLCVHARQPITANQAAQLTGIKDGQNTKTKWDTRYSKRSYVYGKAPVKFLATNFEYIPYGGTVLDMGMGEGRNAVFLAQKGYLVTGVDVSSVAVKKARILAKEYGVKLQTMVASLNKYDFPKENFDAIIVFYYVDRSLTEKIVKWLKPGGVLIFESHTVKQRKKKEFANEPVEYFLKEQELLTMFKGFKILKYEEPQHMKNYRASIILEKPKGKK